jgi:hypothetical protein
LAFLHIHRFILDGFVFSCFFAEVDGVEVSGEGREVQFFALSQKSVVPACLVRVDHSQQLVQFWIMGAIQAPLPSWASMNRRSKAG